MILKFLHNALLEANIPAEPVNEQAKHFSVYIYDYSYSEGWPSGEVSHGNNKTYKVEEIGYPVVDNSGKMIGVYLKRYVGFREIEGYLDLEGIYGAGEEERWTNSEGDEKERITTATLIYDGKQIKGGDKRLLYSKQREDLSGFYASELVGGEVMKEPISLNHLPEEKRAAIMGELQEYGLISKAIAMKTRHIFDEVLWDMSVYLGEKNEAHAFPLLDDNDAFVGVALSFPDEPKEYGVLYAESKNEYVHVEGEGSFGSVYQIGKIVKRYSGHRHRLEYDEELSQFIDC